MTHFDLFSGYGGFSLALERCGFQTVAFSEIEPFCCRVLAHHWPHVPNLGDVTQIRGAAVRANVVTAGFPCQDVSVAGKHGGLRGARSGLFWEIVRIIREMQEAGHGPTFALLENVPGLFLSHGGRDFATVLRGLAELRPLDICWRVLDAQFFGVPQRRRRVFIVVDFGGERAAEILALTEGVPRHSTPRPEAEKGVADAVARCFKGRGNANHREDSDTYIPILEVGQRCGRTDHNEGLGIDQPGDPMFTLQVGAQHGVFAPLTAKAAKGTGGPSGDECQNLVTHSLRADGFDASEDGTGRGTPIVAFNTRQDPDTSSGLIGPLDTDGHTQAVMFHENQHAEVAMRETASLQVGGGKPGQGYPAVLHAMSVRRLTPRECERLQGLPDNFTALLGAADGPRYRALGNGVAVPVVEWIAQRIVTVGHL